MRKKILLIAVITVCCAAQMVNTKDLSTTDLILENIDAMAEPEVSVGPFCIVTKDICFTEPNGFFIKGYRQYF